MKHSDKVEGHRWKSVEGITGSSSFLMTFPLSRVVTAIDEKEAFLEAEKLYKEENEEMSSWTFVWEKVTVASLAD